MRHIFVINEYAGRGSAASEIQQALQKTGRDDWEIYCTTGPADATAFVRRYCESCAEPVRFYACGGDGTLQEVVNGAVGHPQAAVTAYACGSGNDFVKYYGGQDLFLDIPALLQAQETPVDLIRTDMGIYAINACHFGFDSAVAKTMNAVRHNKLFGGKRAYLTGVIKALFTSMVTRCTVTVDGEVLNPDGRLLLCTIANGQYVGGSYRCAPRSHNDDGLLEICLVRPLSHVSFLRLMNVYKTGAHLCDPRLKKYITYRRAKTVELSSPDPKFACSLDGEVVVAPHLAVTVAKQAIPFSVPPGAHAIAVDPVREAPETVLV